MSKNKKILIIDDNIDILEALQLFFETQGWEVVTSQHGNQVLELIKQHQPSAVILDVLLSGVDGRKICRELKSQPATKNIPVIMISAHPDAATSTKQAGADDFLAKPFDINELFKKLQQHAHI